MRLAHPDRRADMLGAVMRVVRPGRVLVGVAATLIATSLGLALYHRPWGDHFWIGTHPGRTGLHMGLRGLLALAHSAAAYIGLAVGLLVVVRAWLQRQAAAAGAGLSRVCLAVAAVVALLALASAHAVPWDTTLPWSDRPRLRPALLDGDEGPFPELVGIASRYETGRDRRRVVTAVALVHAIVPIVGAALVLACVRRRRGDNAPDDDGDGEDAPVPQPPVS